MQGVEVRRDSLRGCGWRSPGGLYLVSGGVGMPCGKLPIPLKRCPTCDHAIKPSSSWTWVEPSELLRGLECSPQPEHHALCPAADPERIGRAGLLWIGEKFYKPAEWTAEADRLGVSRRIPAVPKGFVVGQTWVLVAHRHVVVEPCTEPVEGHSLALEKRKVCEKCQGSGFVKTPGIFHVFRPTAVEYVVKGTETQEEIDRLRKRGITPVQVVRDETPLLEDHADSQDDG